jgi:diacylglycerol kinase family enzyme
MERSCYGVAAPPMPWLFRFDLPEPAASRRRYPAMRAILVHNPSAGSEVHNKNSMLAAFKLADIDVLYVSTKEDNVKAALKKDADLVVVAGGDGTVARVLTSMPDRSVPVGILPLGSANNIARSLGIAGTPQELVESWRTEHTCRLDIVAVKEGRDTSLFLEGFGVGLLPDFFKRTAKKNENGKIRGAESLLQGRAELRRVLKSAKPIDIEIRVDDQAFGREVFGVEVLNTAYTGPGLPLAAAADSGDGLLDVICFEVSQRGAMLDWIDVPSRGRPPAKARQGAKIELKWQGEASRIDDDLFDKNEKTHSLEIACQSQSARILMPIIHPAPRAQRAKVTNA